MYTHAHILNLSIQACLGLDSSVVVLFFFSKGTGVSYDAG